MPLDPTLDELAGRSQMTHWPAEPNPVRNFMDYAQEPAPPRAPLPGEERINQALTRQDPRYVPSQPPQQQNWQRWMEEALSNIPFGFPGTMAGRRGFEELAARGGSGQALADLAQANQMEALGAGRQGIWQGTEWYKDPSDIWSREIPDNPATLNEHEIPQAHNFRNSSLGFSYISTTLGKVLNHPDLYDVYPNFKNIPLIFSNDPAAHNKGESAKFIFPTTGYPNGAILINNPHRTSNQQIKSELLHEIQHVTDMYEGHKGQPTGNLTGRAYLDLISEARARNTQERAKYTPDQLKRLTPWLTMEHRMKHPVGEGDLILPPP